MTIVCSKQLRIGKLICDFAEATRLANIGAAAFYTLDAYCSFTVKRICIFVELATEARVAQRATKVRSAN